MKLSTKSRYAITAVIDLANNIDTAVSLKVIDPAKVNQMMSTVSVSQLAKSQTLVFDGFASDNLSCPLRPSF